MTGVVAKWNRRVSLCDSTKRSINWSKVDLNDPLQDPYNIGG